MGPLPGCFLVWALSLAGGRMKERQRPPWGLLQGKGGAPPPPPIERSGLCSSQILAVAIFVVMFIEIVREKIPRHVVTLVAGGLTLVVVFLLTMHSWPDVWQALSFQAWRRPPSGTPGPMGPPA